MVVEDGVGPTDSDAMDVAMDVDRSYNALLSSFVPPKIISPNQAMLEAMESKCCLSLLVQIFD